MRLLLILTLISCSTYDQFVNLSEELNIPTQVFNANFNKTWAAAVGVMKDYDIEVQNQEIGLIKTRWMENTTDINFSDSFGSQDKIKSARFKIVLNVDSLSEATDNRTKVTILKRQLVEDDYLQGWREVKNDKTLEKTLLYRINRLIKIESYLQKIQKEKEAEQLKELE